MHFAGSKVTEYWNPLPSTEPMPKAMQLGVMVRNAKLWLSVAGTGLSSPTPAMDSSTQRQRSMFTQISNKDYRFVLRAFKANFNWADLNNIVTLHQYLFSYLTYCTQCVFSLLSQKTAFVKLFLFLKVTFVISLAKVPE